MELNRDYRSLFLDGNAISQVVLQCDGKYMIFDAGSLFMVTDNCDFYGQDFAIDLDIKRGNKSLFKDDKMPVLKESRIVPYGSIPYEIKKEYYGDDNWLFLKADKVNIEVTSDDPELKNTGNDVRYSFEIDGISFVCKRWAWTVNKKQAIETVYSNLKESIYRHYGLSALDNINQDLALLDSVNSGKMEIVYESIDRNHSDISLRIGKTEFVKNRVSKYIKSDKADFLNKYSVSDIIDEDIEKWII